MPNKPISPLKTTFVEISRKGADTREPDLMIRIVPPCSTTNERPLLSSGVSKSSGLERPDTTVESAMATGPGGGGVGEPDPPQLGKKIISGKNKSTRKIRNMASRQVTSTSSFCHTQAQYFFFCRVVKDKNESYSQQLSIGSHLKRLL